MRPNLYAAGIGAVLIAAMACVGPTALAAPKKRVASNPPRARITVERRSFLDAGTEVAPGDRKFTDYAFPPGHTPYSGLGPFKDFRRQPLPDPWDLPGASKGW